MGANQFIQSTDEIINDAQLTYRTDKKQRHSGITDVEREYGRQSERRSIFSWMSPIKRISST